VVRPTVCR